MRARRGRGHNLGRGLSGMTRTSLLPGGILLARPLIGVSRQSLRQYLRGFPQSFVEDPSNDDPSYERVRVRRQLLADPALAGRLRDFAVVMGRWRRVLAHDTAELLAHLASVRPGPVFLFQLDVALAAPRPVLVHAVQVLLAVCGGAEQLAARDKVEALISGFASGDSERANLAGVIVEREGRHLRLYREMRDIEQCIIEPGETHLWEGRLEIANGSRQTIEVRPVTRSGLAHIEKERSATLPGRPRAALHSSPLIVVPGGKQYLPMIEENGLPPLVHARMTARAIEHFCPQPDFPLLDWLRGIEVARRACLLPRP
jgi:tRNA(Ile)-lysidine synthase